MTLRFPLTFGEVLQHIFVKARHGNEQTAGAFELSIDLHFESGEVFFVRRLVTPPRFDKIGEATEVEGAIHLLTELPGRSGVLQLVGPEEICKELFQSIAAGLAFAVRLRLAAGQGRKFRTKLIERLLLFGEVLLTLSGPRGPVVASSLFGVDDDAFIGRGAA